MGFLHVLTIFGSEGPSGISALGIDPIAILAQAVTFLALFFILKKFALSGIVETLEKRRKVIDDGVRLGQQMEAEKEKLDEQVDKVLHKARDEADRIIADAHVEAGNVMKEAEDRAARKMDAMLDDAHKKIDEEINYARRELKKETLQLVAHATEIIIDEKLDATKDAGLVERALEKVR